jgi:hypothetical protein
VILPPPDRGRGKRKGTGAGSGGVNTVRDAGGAGCGGGGKRERRGRQGSAPRHDSKQRGEILPLPARRELQEGAAAVDGGEAACAGVVVEGVEEEVVAVEEEAAEVAAKEETKCTCLAIEEFVEPPLRVTGIVLEELGEGWATVEDVCSAEVRTC